MGAGSDIRESCLERAMGGLRPKDWDWISWAKGVWGWSKRGPRRGKSTCDELQAEGSDASRNVFWVAGAMRGEEEGSWEWEWGGGCCCEVKQGQDWKECLEFSNKLLRGTSLVTQWWRIRLPIQGTWVPSLVWEDPRCQRVAKPVCQSYRAHTLEAMSHSDWVHEQQLLKLVRPTAGAPQRETPPQGEAHAPQLEQARLVTARESPQATTKTQCIQK